MRSTKSFYVGGERNALMRKRKHEQEWKLFVNEQKATKEQKEFLAGIYGGNIDMTNLSFEEAYRLIKNLKEG